MVTHQWDAGTYDRISNPQVRWAAAVLDRLELQGDELVLDAGCGTGRVTERLLERLPRGAVVAVDADAAMLAEAAVRLARFGHQVKLVQADLLQPLTLDRPVDAVFSTAAFHWIKDHRRLFRNLAAVIRPGGQLVAQFGGAGNIASVLQAIRAAGDDWEGPWVYPEPQETAAILEDAGFERVHVWLYPEPTPFDTEAELSEFLEKVCLGAHLARRPEAERAAFVADVVRHMPRREIDYIRSNIVARRAARR